MNAFVAPGGRGADGVFWGGLLLLFALAVGTTWSDVVAMASMPAMPMPGGWRMSMQWMRMPGQSWHAAALAFLGMWMPMMTAMMLPVLAPSLRRYRRSLGDAGVLRREGLTAAVAAGYLCVWGALGLAVFPFGALLAQLAMQHSSLARAAPLALGGLVVIAGALQFTAWKMRHLACWCALSNAGTTAEDFRTASRHGLRLGLHCVHCCAGPTAVLFAVGSMNPRAMVAATAVIAIERLATDERRAAKRIGAVAIATGVWLIVAVLRGSN